MFCRQAVSNLTNIYPKVTADFPKTMFQVTCCSTRLPEGLHTDNQTFPALRITCSFPLPTRNRLEADTMECPTSGNPGPTGLGR